MARLRILAPLTALVVVLVAAGVAKPSGDPPPSGPAATFQVDGTVAKPLTLTVDDLRALPKQRVKVSFESAAGTQHHVYKGPLLYDVLAQAGPTFDPAVKNDALRHVVAVTGSDGYTAVVSWGEIDPGFAGRPILLATSEDGRPLDTDGPRLVVPGDVKGGRYVTNVVDVKLVNAAPSGS